MTFTKMIVIKISCMSVHMCALCLGWSCLWPDHKYLIELKQVTYHPEKCSCGKICIMLNCGKHTEDETYKDH